MKPIVTEEMAADFDAILDRMTARRDTRYIEDDCDALSEWLAKHFPEGEAEAVELTHSEWLRLWTTLGLAGEGMLAPVANDYLASLGLKLVRVKPEAAKVEPPLLKPGDPCPRFKDHLPIVRSDRDGWLYCPECHADYVATWHRDEAEDKADVKAKKEATPLRLTPRQVENLRSVVHENPGEVISEEQPEATADDRLADIERRLAALELGYRDAKSTNMEIQDDVDRLDAATAELLEWCKRLSRDKTSDAALEARKPEAAEKSAGRVFSEAEVREVLNAGEWKSPGCSYAAKCIAARLGIDLEATK